MSERPGGSGDFRPDLLTQTAVETYLKELEARGYSGSHRSRVKSVASGFAGWLIEEKGLLRKNPTRGVEVPAQARAVFFNRLGELRDRSYEDQQGRASGLTLLTAAIALWNAVYLQRVVAELRARGEETPEEYLRHLSPLEWEHITLTGVYRWNLGEVHEAPGWMRPLRKLSPTPV